MKIKKPEKEKRSGCGIVIVGVVKTNHESEN
jgi:hypothetical protein